MFGSQSDCSNHTTHKKMLQCKLFSPYNLLNKDLQNKLGTLFQGLNLYFVHCNCPRDIIERAAISFRHI